MTVLCVDFALRRVMDRIPTTPAAPLESRDERLRRRVLERCASLGIPSDIANYHASQAAQITRRNPTRETSGIADNAVSQANRAFAARRNPPPPTPSAA